MTTLVAPKTCRRCKGTGNVRTVVVHQGVPGTCFTCDGSGKVEGDKATLAAAKAAREHAAEVGAAVAAWSLQHRRGGLRDGALIGLELLERDAPERAAKARESIFRGHPGVTDALVAFWMSYGPSERELRWHARFDMQEA